jgi:hypothetical protein
LTIKQRYLFDFGDKSKKKLKHNVEVIRKLNDKHGEEKNENSILNYKVKELAVLYFQSKVYLNDLDNIEKEESLEYRNVFEMYATGDEKHLGFIDYFCLMNGNKKKK